MAYPSYFSNMVSLLSSFPNTVVNLNRELYECTWENWRNHPHRSVVTKNSSFGHSFSPACPLPQRGDPALGWCCWTVPLEAVAFCLLPVIWNHRPYYNDVLLTFPFRVFLRVDAIMYCHYFIVLMFLKRAAKKEAIVCSFQMNTLLLITDGVKYQPLITFLGHKDRFIGKNSEWIQKRRKKKISIFY